MFLIRIFISLIYQIKYLITFLVAFIFIAASAQEDGGKRLRNSRKNPVIKTRIGISPVLGLYKSNKHHTSGTRPKMAYNISLKEEIRINKKKSRFFNDWS